jgi:phosphate acetyltransferase
MSNTIMLVPASVEACVASIALGLVDSINSRSVKAELLEAFDAEIIEAFLSANKQEELLITIVEQTEAHLKHNAIVVVQGIPVENPYAAELNLAIATALNATIIFVVAAVENVVNKYKTISNSYINKQHFNILGYLINKGTQDILNDKQLKYLGAIPYRAELGEATAQYSLELAKTWVSKFIDVSWLWQMANSVSEKRITPPYFRHYLIQRAQQAHKCIVLPEGDEPRTMRAANFCAEQKLAQCILLGNQDVLHKAAQQNGITLHDGIKIIDPATIRDKYIQPLYELRREKGMTEAKAQQELQDNVMLGTMMLKLDDVDGLVSGAVHTTANTIRPALQVIKTTHNIKLISSIFFMCLPEQVLMYGDCAINPDPTAETLASIAIQSADSALAFGFNPRIAMLSYSTGTSGFGISVDKVKQATELALKIRPDLLIDGPLQYDAAIVPEVATLKAPKSLIAGKANIFIFPDLNAGNIAYKAVQRGANIICIGPMLQGLQKPVNDLSRGCLVEDIVYTIALTAIQAANVKP